MYLARKTSMWGLLSSHVLQIDIYLVIFKDLMQLVVVQRAF